MDIPSGCTHVRARSFSHIYTLGSEPRQQTLMTCLYATDIAAMHVFSNMRARALLLLLLLISLFSLGIFFYFSSVGSFSFYFRTRNLSPLLFPLSALGVLRAHWAFFFSPIFELDGSECVQTTASVLHVPRRRTTRIIIMSWRKIVSTLMQPILDGWWLVIRAVSILTPGVPFCSFAQLIPKLLVTEKSLKFVRSTSQFHFIVEYIREWDLHSQIYRFEIVDSLRLDVRAFYLQ